MATKPHLITVEEENLKEENLKEENLKKEKLIKEKKQIEDGKKYYYL
jgi:hypothetical protein